MKKFMVTFVEKKKYNPATRTLLVETTNEFNAERVIKLRFNGVTILGTVTL